MGKSFNFADKLCDHGSTGISSIENRWFLWMEMTIRARRVAKMVDAREVVNSTYLRLVEEDAQFPPCEDYDFEERFRTAAMKYLDSKCRQGRREVARETTEGALEDKNARSYREDVTAFMPNDYSRLYPSVRNDLDANTTLYGDFFLEALALGLKTDQIAARLSVTPHDIYSARQKLSRRLRLELQETANDR